MLGCEIMCAGPSADKAKTRHPTLLMVLLLQHDSSSIAAQLPLLATMI